MKKSFTKATAIILVFMLMLGSAATGIGGFANVLDSISFKAGAATVDDLKYEINSGKVTITGYEETLSGALVIPGEIEGYPVTAIKNYAFSNSSLKSVVIPDSVTDAGSGVFYGCTKDFYIAHKLQNGKIERIKSGSYKIEGRYVIFTVTSFSNFMYIQEKIPEIKIAGYRAQRSEGYKSTGTFHAVAENMPEGATIQWFVNGSKVGTGETFTKEKATSTYEIQVKVVAADGTVLAESQTEKVEISSGFIARIIAFFRQLLRRLPSFDQK